MNPRFSHLYSPIRDTTKPLIGLKLWMERESADFIRSLLQTHNFQKQHAQRFIAIQQHTQRFISIQQHAQRFIAIQQHTQRFIAIQQHTQRFIAISFWLIRCTIFDPFTQYTSFTGHIPIQNKELRSNKHEYWKHKIGPGCNNNSGCPIPILLMIRLQCTQLCDFFAVFPFCLNSGTVMRLKWPFGNTWLTTVYLGLVTPFILLIHLIFIL